MSNLISRLGELESRFPTDPANPFVVYCADNFHYEDADEVFRQGAYPTFDAALAACKRMVDQELTDALKPGVLRRVAAKELYEYYMAFGVDPFIEGPCNDRSFSASNYAKVRCSQMLGPPDGAAPEPSRWAKLRSLLLTHSRAPR
jgi:hypothetical protein